eukprot:3682470-Prymnesium_polylepis.2
MGTAVCQDRVAAPFVPEPFLGPFAGIELTKAWHRVAQCSAGANGIPEHPLVVHMYDVRPTPLQRVDGGGSPNQFRAGKRLRSRVFFFPRVPFGRDGSACVVSPHRLGVAPSLQRVRWARCRRIARRAREDDKRDRRSRHAYAGEKVKQIWRPDDSLIGRLVCVDALALLVPRPAEDFEHLCPPPV